MDTSERKDTNKTFVIPDPVCQEVGLACTWRSNDQFAVFPSRRSSTHGAKSGGATNVYHIRRDVPLYAPSVRKLVNEANGTFLSLQAMSKREQGTGESSANLLKVSRAYRSIVRACLETLQEESTEAKTCEEKSRLSSLVTILYSVECIWQLCEILYVENGPDIEGPGIGIRVLEWVRWQAPRGVAVHHLLQQAERGMETRAEFWPALTDALLQGHMESARDLLALHSKHHTQPYRLADDALRTMPVYTVYSGISTGEFTISWKHWQLDCQTKINAKLFQTEPQLELIMKIVSGDTAALESVRAGREWWQVLGAWLLYRAPVCSRRDLARHARAAHNLCAATYRQQPHPHHLDCILLALMEGELHEVINEIQQISDSCWFATHLTDLLYHCGKLVITNENQLDVTDQLRSSLIMEYGSTLMEHHSLWSVGLSYLASVGHDGLNRAHLLLQHLPLGSEARVMKILHEARKYNLHDVVGVVCGAASVRCRRSGRWGSALAWAVRGRCSALAAQAAEAILRHYTATGELLCTDMLLTLGPSMLISDRLVFLGKYCEFHRLYKAGIFKEAGTLLISLLTSKITPKYFWTTLLLDTLPLLESDEIVLSSDDTYEIMQCVEENGAQLAKEDADKEQLLRLSLARNLARTILGEQQQYD